VDESKTIRGTNDQDDTLTNTTTNREIIQGLRTIINLLDVGLWMDAFWTAKAMLMAIERGDGE